MMSNDVIHELDNAERYWAAQFETQTLSGSM